MPGSKPRVGILVADGNGMPPGLEPLMAEADVELLHSGSGALSQLATLDVLAVYDFRTTMLDSVNAGAAPRLRWLHASSAGVDAVLTPGIVESGITVTNARGVFDPGIAEYVLGLLLYFAKDFRTTLQLQRERTWQHRESQLLRGKHLLVVGAGSIGTAIGKLAEATGMRLSAVARSARDDAVFGRVHATSALHELLPQADAVAVAAPLTRETRSLFDARAFAAMKPGAWFINVGRGPVVDEAALVAALRSGHLGAAGIDVFVHEPLPAESPLWEMPNVVVSPHMAGDVVGWERQLAELFIENFRRWQRDDTLHNVVDTAAAAAVRDRPHSGEEEPTT